jgi:hypothetical protein
MLAAGDSFVVVLVIGIVGFVIAMIVWGAKHQKAVRENWANFARRHNLQYAGTTFGGITGWFGAAQIRINTITRGSGKNRSTYTQFHATIGAPMPAGLVLYKEGFFSKLGKVFGGDDVQVGDPNIDNAFIIKATDLLGTHTLLSLTPVKQGLLYTVARHPGLRIEARTVFWEQNGVAHKPEQLEANAADLAYIVEIFNAAYQQLSGAQPQQAPQRAAAPPPRPSRTAEVLQGTSQLGISPAPQVRQAEPEQRQAMAEVAGAFKALEQKIENGEHVPQPKPVSLDDAFKSEPSASAADDAFAEPDAGDAFKDPEPLFEAPTQSGPAKQAASGSLKQLVEALSKPGSMSSEREKIIAANAKMEWPLEVTVDRIDSTFGFDVPDSLRDGRTIEGHVGDMRVAVRLSKARNAEIDKLRSGESVSLRAAAAGWDDLFKKLTLNAD